MDSISNVQCTCMPLYSREHTKTDIAVGDKKYIPVDIHFIRSGKILPKNMLSL